MAKARRPLTPQERFNIRQDCADGMGIQALSQKYKRARSHIETVTMDIRKARAKGEKPFVGIRTLGDKAHATESAIVADEQKRLSNLCKEFREKAKKILVKSKVRSVQIFLDREKQIADAARTRTLRFSE